MWKWKPIRNKKQLFNTALFVLLLLFYDGAVITKRLIVSQVLEVKKVSLAAFFFMIVGLMVTIKNRYWKYGFSFMLFAVVLNYFSIILAQTSRTYSIALSVASFLMIVPSLLCINRFRTDDTENILVLGEYNDNPTKKLLRIGLALVIAYLMFFLGSLWFKQH